MSSTVNLHVCPNKCKSATFVTTAHVTQDWRVDPLGNFLEQVDGCVQVDSEPDDDNFWGCSECGAEAELIECRRTETKITNMINGQPTGDGLDLSVFMECHTPLGKAPRAFVIFDGIAGVTEYEAHQAPDGTWHIEVEGNRICLN